MCSQNQPSSSGKMWQEMHSRLSLFCLFVWSACPFTRPLHNTDPPPSTAPRKGLQLEAVLQPCSPSLSLKGMLQLQENSRKGTQAQKCRHRSLRTQELPDFDLLKICVCRQEWPPQSGIYTVTRT